MAKDKVREKGGLAVLDRSPSHLLHRALQTALDIYADEIGESALTQRQYAVLAAAEAHAGATQTDLVRLTGIDRSTLADMVARMITKGLLERERSSLDARANAVRLTETGRDVLVEADPKVAAADVRLLKLLPGGGKRGAFLELLRNLVQAADAPPPGPKAPKPPKAEKPPKDEGRKKKKKARKAEKVREPQPVLETTEG